MSTATGQQAGIPVACHADGRGAPLSAAAVERCMTGLGIHPQPEDLRDDAEPCSDPAGWSFADQTCGYVAAVIAGIPDDGPPPPEKAKKGRGRHQWLLNQEVRLHCAKRLGCLSQTDWHHAQDALERRLTELRAATNETVPRLELPGARKLGRQRAAAKTDDEARAELGGHGHDTAEETAGKDSSESSDSSAGGANGKSSRSRHAKVTLANTIAPRRVSWAWVGSPQDSPEDARTSRAETENVRAPSGDLEGRIPAGTLAAAAGPEGVGKSSFAIWLAAQVSTGMLPGAWYGTPRMVLYCTVEDSWGYTIVPRLIAADADLSLVGRFDVVSQTDEVLAITLPADNDLLATVIKDHRVALVVLDPLLSMMSAQLDSHHERQTRQALDPLAKIADTTGAVLLGIAHWNKGGGADVTVRITGSGAFKNVPRAVFAFARDPDTEDEFVMTQTKNSLGRYDLPSIRYRMDSAPVEHNGELIDYTGRFTPIGVSDRSVSDILGARDDDTGTDQFTPAQRFVLGYVATHGDQDNEVPCAEVFTDGAPAGYEERDLIKARNKIKHLVGTRKDGMKGGWVWFLTDHPDNGPRKEGGSQPQGGTEGGEGGSQRDTPPSPPPSGAAGASRSYEFNESTNCAGQDTNQSSYGYESTNSDDTPRRPGCVCTAQPHPCHWCELAASKAEEGRR
jgi:hypothetical protein